MPLVLLGFAASFILAWFYRRGRRLSRDCVWREDRRRAGPGEAYFHCLACGAELRLPKGQGPRACLRPPSGR